ncbi:hypothetical protein L9F63_019218, partial [Diploptera punctata]
KFNITLAPINKFSLENHRIKKEVKLLKHMAVWIITVKRKKLTVVKTADDGEDCSPILR